MITAFCAVVKTVAYLNIDMVGVGDSDLWVGGMYEYSRFFEILKRGPANEEQKKELKRIYKNANLVMAHGKKAVMTLVGRGVGPDTAARILARVHTDEDEFLREILAAEIIYARTKKFWD